MASLILKGDLLQSASETVSSKILSIPILIDQPGGQTNSELDKLLVDRIHETLVTLFEGEEQLAPNAFVVNLSIGIRGSGFVGSMSPLANLIDWAAEKYGILFNVSAGNIVDDLYLIEQNALEFQDATPKDQWFNIRNALLNHKHERTLFVPAETANGLTIGALSSDLTTPSDPHSGSVRPAHGDLELPATSSALGLGYKRSVKPDLLAAGGIHAVRALSSGNDTRLRPHANDQTCGLNVAVMKDGQALSRKSRGTSDATALTTRAALLAEQALVAEGGPFYGQELSRLQKALMAKALIVNSTTIDKAIQERFIDHHPDFDKSNDHQMTKRRADLARLYGYGVLDERHVVASPTDGVTLCAYGNIRVDHGQLFELPLPPSLATMQTDRRFRVTLAWFSPIDQRRAAYRAVRLVAHAEDRTNHSSNNNEWAELALKGDQVDHNQLNRGTVWSKRLVQKRTTVGSFGADDSLFIRVDCWETAKGIMEKTQDVEFAIVVSLELPVGSEIDVHEEVKSRIQLKAAT